MKHFLILEKLVLETKQKKKKSNEKIKKSCNSKEDSSNI